MDTFSRYDGTRLSSQDSARTCEHTGYETKERLPQDTNKPWGMSVSVSATGTFDAARNPVVRDARTTEEDSAEWQTKAHAAQLFTQQYRDQASSHTHDILALASYPLWPNDANILASERNTIERRSCPPLAETRSSGQR